MGQYTEALQTTIRQQLANGKTVDQAYAFILGKLTAAMKQYEAGTNELLGIGNTGGIIAPQQQSLFKKLEEVRQTTADMILDLEQLKLDNWKP